MIQEGLRVAVPLKDKTLGVVAVEVQLVLQSPGVFSAHQFRAFRGETLKLVKLAIMDFESSDTLKFAHCSYLLLLPEDVGYLAAPPNYNSTKVDFAYFGFSPGGAPDKTKACLLFYRRLRSRASRNLPDTSAQNSPLFELARVLVRFDHIARCIVNANHGLM
jgi:hypothetical protein